MDWIPIPACLLLLLQSSQAVVSDLLSVSSFPRLPVQNITNYSQRTVIKIPYGRLPGLMRYVPKGKQLKEKRLRRRMGKDFDENWMSVEEPIGWNNKGIEITGPDTVGLQIIEDLENMTKLFKFRTDNTSNTMNETVNVFKAWLLSYGSCRVRYVWEDLSVLFWPRWVKRGFCETDVSCSWPAGMHCTPSESKIIKLLRWNCKRRKRGSKHNRNKNKSGISNRNKIATKPKKRRTGKKIKCRWIKVPYPVTDECVCSC